MFELVKAVDGRTMGVKHTASGLVYQTGTRVFDLFVHYKQKGAELAAQRFHAERKREKQLLERLTTPVDVCQLWCLPKDGRGLPCVPAWLVQSEQWNWFTDKLKVKEPFTPDKP